MTAALKWIRIRNPHFFVVFVGFVSSGKVKRFDNAPIGRLGDGRGRNGRLLPGKRGGPGNPHARRVNKLRSAMLKAVTPRRLVAVVKAIPEKAEAGDVAVTALVLAYAVGKPRDDDDRPVLLLQADQLIHQVQQVDADAMRALVDLPART